MIIIYNNDEYECVKDNYNDYIIQEYIIGDTEYTGDFICNNGYIIGSMIFKQKYSQNIFIKNSSMDNFEIVELNLDVFKIILEKINYTGICNIDFKLIDNKIYIFEINPRCGGTIILSDNLFKLLEQIN